MIAWHTLCISSIAFRKQCYDHSAKKENSNLQTSLIITFSPLAREVSQSSMELGNYQTSRNKADLSFMVLFHSRGRKSIGVGKKKIFEKKITDLMKKHACSKHTVFVGLVDLLILPSNKNRDRQLGMDEHIMGISVVSLLFSFI